MFGYLNLNDPTKIGNNEAQEAKNLQLDRGYLEIMTEYAVDPSIGRKDQDINGREIFIDLEALTTGNAVAPVPAKGYLKRRLSASRVDVLGSPRINDLPGFSDGVSPLITAAAYGSQPVPAGTYSYLITAYNPETNEESATFAFNLIIGTNQVGSFANFPAVSANPIFLEKTSIEWRIYRRPIGGAEFLRILPTTTIQAYNVNAGPYLDITPDESLGDACGTVDVYPPDYYPTGRLFSLFTVHNGRLWFKQDSKRAGSPGLDAAASVLYYSDRYIFGQVPQLNFFAFNSEIVGLHSVDESLVVLCKKNIFVIYGDDRNDFVVKELTDSKSNIGCVGGWSSAALRNAVFFLGSSKTDPDQADGLFVISGGRAERLSYQVDTLFPFGQYGASISGGPIIYGAGVIRDRFFVVRGKVEGTLDNGLLVYDSITKGFLIAEDPNPSPPTDFFYRSKDFGSPGKWDDMRRAFVRGVGNFKIELYYDGIKEDEIEISIAGTIPKTEDFTVPPFRSNYFSFRILGEANAKIHEFGRLE
jgi:hypothetical protein